MTDAINGHPRSKPKLPLWAHALAPEAVAGEAPERGQFGLRRRRRLGQVGRGLQGPAGVLPHLGLGMPAMDGGEVKLVLRAM